MKKNLLILFSGLIILSLSSCGGEENIDPLLICGVTDPVLEFPWLNEITTDVNSSNLSEFFYLVAGDYQGANVFILRNCCPNCGTIQTVYSCTGQEIGTYGVDVNPAEISREQVIWRGFNASCGV